MKTFDPETAIRNIDKQIEHVTRIKQANSDEFRDADPERKLAIANENADYRRQLAHMERTRDKFEMLMKDPQVYAAMQCADAMGMSDEEFLAEYGEEFNSLWRN